MAACVFGVVLCLEGVGREEPASDLQLPVAAASAGVSWLAARDKSSHLLPSSILHILILLFIFTSGLEIHHNFTWNDAPPRNVAC